MSTSVPAATYVYGFMFVKIESFDYAYLLKRLTESDWGLFRVSWAECLLMEVADEMPLLQSLRCIKIGSERDCMSEATCIANEKMRASTSLCC